VALDAATPAKPPRWRARLLLFALAPLLVVVVAGVVRLHEADLKQADDARAGIEAVVQSELKRTQRRADDERTQRELQAKRFREKFDELVRRATTPEVRRRFERLSKALAGLLATRPSFRFLENELPGYDMVIASHELSLSSWEPSPNVVILDLTRDGGQALLSQWGDVDPGVGPFDMVVAGTPLRVVLFCVPDPNRDGGYRFHLYVDVGTVSDAMIESVESASNTGPEKK
jgi:hypothetical protein